MSLSVTGAHVCVLSFYFLYLFVGAGACGWVVGTAMATGWFHPAGVGLLSCFQHLTSTCDEFC